MVPTSSERNTSRITGILGSSCAIRQHTSAYVSKRQQTSANARGRAAYSAAAAAASVFVLLHQ
jgi:hypothetical protein